MSKTLVILFTVVLSSSALGQHMNGVSLWSDDTTRTALEFEFLKKTNASWVSLQPFGVLTSDTSGVEFNRDDIWECSSFDGLIKHIQILHDMGFMVFVKPHIIVKYDKVGAWSGDLKLNSEKKWKIFENSYAKYISELAVIADSMDVELFSVGTELGTYTTKRSDHFESLIDTLRTLFNGGLTYCANFDYYHKFPLWKKVDVMGIDAYFTVDQSKNTSIENCMEGWKPIAAELEKFSKLHDKKVLFTEFGYMSADYCAKTPFGGSANNNVNLAAQANAYRAIFSSFWYKPWFVGGFSWFWRFDNDQPENYDNTSFSPQNKPAENIISNFYLKHP